MRNEVAELFHQLADLSPEARTRYFAEHRVDGDTRREVEELLAHDSTEADVATQAIAMTAAQALQGMDATGKRCGAFRLVSVIGRGGMGMVYLAERVDGEVKQRAAVKLLHPGWSEVHRERFLQEREILATLTHPNIAHLLDAGHLEDGQPYFAMEYVEGKTIDRHCEGFSVGQKIELFLKVCGSVEYLHRNLMVHRDLKPGNIMVSGSGEPKLLDFGIAKLLEMDSDLTLTHLRMLTPSYASPEQLAGGVVGTSSDVYSLGAVLHTLLTGKPPQEARPSELAPEVKGDLELVLQMALRHEPRERYASVAEFARDLRAFLGSHGIRARQGDRVYRVRKFVRRYWVPAALTGALAASVLSAGGLIWYRSRPGPAVKLLRPERLTSNTSELPVQAAAISPDGRSIAYSDPLGIHIRDVASGSTQLLPETKGHVLERWLPDGARLTTRVQDTGSERKMMVFTSGVAPVPTEAGEPWVDSPDGKLRAKASADEQALTLQEAGGHSRELWRAGERSALDEFQWSPNSKSIAVVSRRGTTSALEAIDVSTGSKKTLLAYESKMRICSMVWPAQNRIVVATVELVGANAYNSNLWEFRLNGNRMPVPRKLTAWTDFPIQSGSLTTDGKRLVFLRRFAQRDVYVAEIDAARTRLGIPRRLTLELGDDYPTAWTRDSRSVILASDRTGSIRIFRQDLDQQTADPLSDWPGPQIVPRMTPDGKSVLFCGMVPKDRTCQLIRVPLRGGAAVQVAAVPNIGDVRCSAAGACTVAQLRDGGGYVVFALDAVHGAGREIYRDADRISGSPDISPDGKWLAATSGTKIILRSFATGAVVREIAVHEARSLRTLDYAPDGRGFFSGDASPAEARQLYIDLSGKATVLLRQPGNVATWSIPSPDGRHLAMLMYTIDSNVYMVEDF